MTYIGNPITIDGPSSMPPYDEDGNLTQEFLDSLRAGGFTDAEIEQFVEGLSEAQAEIERGQTE